MASLPPACALQVTRRLWPFALAGGLLALLTWAIDPAELASTVARLGWVDIASILVATLLYNVLRGVAWHCLLVAAGTPISVGESVMVYLAGQAAGLLPAGQLALSALLKQLKDEELGESASSVVLMELLYGAIGAVAAVTGAAVYQVDRRLVAAGIGLLAVGFTLVLLPGPMALAAKLAARLPCAAPLASEAHLFRVAFLRLLRSPALAPCAVFSAAAFALGSYTLWLPLAALDQRAPSFGAVVFVYAVAHFSVGIPFLPSGVGANEASSIALITWLGAPLAVAGAATLVSRGALLAGGTLIGVIVWLVLRSWVVQRES